jgi:hypothetical protein
LVRRNAAGTPGQDHPGPWQTPTEFAPVVGEAVPSCAAEFELLTRAYEDVRYGSLRLDRPALRELESGQKRIAATLSGG